MSKEADVDGLKWSGKLNENAEQMVFQKCIQISNFKNLFLIYVPTLTTVNIFLSLIPKTPNSFWDPPHF